MFVSFKQICWIKREQRQTNGMGKGERPPRGREYNIRIIQTFTDNPECKRGDLTM